MGISETIFWSRYGRTEERHQRLMPAKPRSVLIAEAREAAARAVEARQRRADELHAAHARLQRLRQSAPELVDSLQLSRKAWKAAAAGSPDWVSEIEPAGVRWQMRQIAERGLANVLDEAEQELQPAVDAAARAAAVAIAMPIDADAETAYKTWARVAAAALDDVMAGYGEQCE